MIVDIKEVAQYFGKTERTIQLWAQDGMPKDGRNQYNLVECAKWRIEILEEKVKDLESGDDELMKYKRENEKLMVQQRKVKLFREMNRLVPLNAMKLAWETQAINFIRILESSELALKGELRDLVGSDEVDEILKKAFIKVRELTSKLNLDIEIEEILD